MSLHIEISRIWILDLGVSDIKVMLWKCILWWRIGSKTYLCGAIWKCTALIETWDFWTTTSSSCLSLFFFYRRKRKEGDSKLKCWKHEYVKLDELVMVRIVDSVEEEKCFSTLAFMKSKLRNRLTTHLPLVVSMFAQQFYILQNFPYVDYIE